MQAIIKGLEKLNQELDASENDGHVSEVFHKGDDGYRMNEVLVLLWYIMGLWPLVYTMLLLPTARRCGHRHHLQLEKNELEKWPFMFLESKITAGISLGAGLTLIGYAALADASVWDEFYQYFRERLNFY